MIIQVGNIYWDQKKTTLIIVPNAYRTVFPSSEVQNLFLEKNSNKISKRFYCQRMRI
jgi:hypothetical protein